MLKRRSFLTGSLAVGASAVFGGAMAQNGSFSAMDRMFPNNTANGPIPTAPGPWSTGSSDPVGIRLLIVIDASSSMNDEEYRIQTAAHGAAFMPNMDIDPITGREQYNLVEAAIRYKGGNRGVAISIVEFSTNAMVRVPWTDFRGDDPQLKEKLALLAGEFATMRRRFNNGTNTVGMLRYAHDVMNACPWQATERKVIDVCSDGRAEGGTAGLERIRDIHAVNGVTINALAIVNEVADLDVYFQTHMVTQVPHQGPDGIWSEPGHTWTIARNMQRTGNDASVFTDLSREVEYALKMKISTEIAGIGNMPRIMNQQQEFDSVENAPLFAPGRNLLLTPAGYQSGLRAPLQSRHPLITGLKHG